MPNRPESLAEVDDRFVSALTGSVASIGAVLEDCRQYLLLVANDELEADLQAKGGASDLVQQTMLEAYIGLSRFEGQNPGELRAWLKQTLLHNIANFRRHYRQTCKRDVSREKSDLGAGPDGRLENLIATDTTSPSGKAMHLEELARLGEVIARLPEDSRRVFQLRHQQHRTFKEIGELMQRSTDAVRMLWWRTFERVAEELERRDGKAGPNQV